MGCSNIRSLIHGLLHSCEDNFKVKDIIRDNRVWNISKNFFQIPDNIMDIIMSIPRNIWPGQIYKKVWKGTPKGTPSVALVHHVDIDPNEDVWD